MPPESEYWACVSRPYMKKRTLNSPSGRVSAWGMRSGPEVRGFQELL